jgi:hypothetical protein
MQYRLDVITEIISTPPQDSKDGKNKLLGRFLNSVMEEDARMQVSSLLM